MRRRAVFWTDFSFDFVYIAEIFLLWLLFFKI